MDSRLIMKITRFALGRVAASVLALVAAGSALAQSSEPKPLWEVGVVGGALSGPAYPASSDTSSKAVVAPFFIYRGEVLRAEQGTLGARLVHGDRYELDVGVAGSLSASSKDVTARAGMPNLGYLAEIGPRLRVKLWDDGPATQLRLDVPLRAVLELHGGVKPQGVALEPELRLSQRLLAGWSVDTSLGMVWGNRKLNQYFYGVDSAYANSARPAYQAEAGLISTRLGVTLSRRLTPDLRLMAFGRVESFAHSANQASPLHLKDTGSSVGVALAWTLGRSEQTGRD